MLATPTAGGHDTFIFASEAAEKAHRLAADRKTKAGTPKTAVKAKKTLYFYQECYRAYFSQEARDPSRRIAPRSTRRQQRHVAIVSVSSRSSSANERTLLRSNVLDRAVLCAMMRFHETLKDRTASPLACKCLRSPSPLGATTLIIRLFSIFFLEKRRSSSKRIEADRDAASRRCGCEKRKRRLRFCHLSMSLGSRFLLVSTLDVTGRCRHVMSSCNRAGGRR